MKLRHFYVAAVTLTLLAFGTALTSIKQPAPQLSATGGRSGEILVDPTQQDGEIPAAMSGQSVHYEMTRFWNSDTGIIGDQTVASLQAIKPTLIRWPGGLQAREMRWAETIGPLSIRSDLPNWVEANKKLVFGVDELVREGRRINPAMGFVITLNSYRSAEEAADFAEYALGNASDCSSFNPTAWLHGQSTAALGYQPGSMPVGYFACLRADQNYGHSSQPYPFQYWEIGNEDDGSYADTPARTATEYEAVATEFSRVIKQRASGVKLGAVLVPYPDAPWNTGMYSLPSGTIDFYVLHSYGWSALKKVIFGYNFEVSVPFQASSEGTKVFRLTAHGTRGSSLPQNTCPWPNIQVSLGARSAQNFSVNSETPMQVNFSDLTESPADHILHFALTNDCYQPNPDARGDTTLFVDKVEQVESNIVSQQGAVPSDNKVVPVSRETVTQLNLITAADFARAQVEIAANLVDGIFAQARQALGTPTPPILMTEFNSGYDFGTYDENDLNRTILSSLYLATTLHGLIVNHGLGAMPWLLQDGCYNCEGDLLYYTNDPPVGRADASGNPYGNSNYWLYRQLADIGPQVKIQADVTNPETFKPVTYLHPDPSSNTPYIQTWAVKRQDGSVRVHVIYLGDESLSLHLKVNHYNVRPEIDVAELKAPGGDLTAFNTPVEPTKSVSTSNRLMGSADETFLVAPLSITSFTYYQPDNTIPPSGGGGGSVSTVTKNPKTTTKQKKTVTQPPVVQQPTAGVSPQTSETTPVLPSTDLGPQIITTKTGLLDNPWFLPIVASILSFLAICLWIIIFWKRHQEHQQSLSPTQLPG